MERRNGDYSRRSIRGGRITLELARKVPLRLGKRNAHGIAPGLDGRSGFGLAGLVSRLPSRRRRRYHRRPIFYRWHDSAWLAALHPICGALEQRWHGQGSGICRARTNRPCQRRTRAVAHGDRTEEHTSELQSRLHLVCRLLLEKKKIDV